MFSKLLILSLILSFSSAFASAKDPISAKIKKYSVFTGLCNQNYVSLRKFKKNDTNYFLAVNTETLQTKIFPEKSLKCVPMDFPEIKVKLKSSAYIKAILEFETNKGATQDAGITHFLGNQRGINLTVDLCPSSKPLDRILFDSLLKSFGTDEKAVPVAISITGNWLIKHKADIDWLVDLENKSLLKITWVNHSYSHRFSKELPLESNFLLKKGTDVKYEVLQNEKLMIERGLLPSIFFRFPGLVSNSQDFSKINSFGLLVIGTDAWLAKNEWPKNGSIVLVHANGNELIGVKRFLKLLAKEKNNIVKKKWVLYDLTDSLKEEAAKKP